MHSDHLESLAMELRTMGNDSLVSDVLNPIPAEGAKEITPDRRLPKADQLVHLVAEIGVELFHDQRGEPYAVVPQEHGRRILAVQSKEFLRWLSHRAWTKWGTAIASETLANARQVLAGQARFVGQQHVLENRVTCHKDAIWVDLDGSRAVRVDGNGWAIIPDPPPLFRSFSHQGTLPEPVPGGDPWQLFQCINVADPTAQLALLCYLVVAFRPDIPIAALLIHGMHGSAKTSLLKIIRSLLDPSRIPVRGGVRDLSEYALAAWENRVLFFDNLTNVPDWLSDTLCRTVSGEGWSKRGLYTDEDSVLFEYRRVIGLAGINQVADRPDLLDRALIIHLDPVDPAHRKEERLFLAEFEEMRPQIFGGLLDALSRAIAIEPTLSLPTLPRMADFARWGAAVAAALGRQPTEFLDAYAQNVERQNEAAVDASPVAQTVLRFMANKNTWSGTPGELLRVLTETADCLNINTKIREWPKTPSWMARRLREVTPTLHGMNIEVIEDRSAKQRLVTFRQRPKNAVIADIEDNTSNSEVTANDKTMTVKSNDRMESNSPELFGYSGSDTNDDKVGSTTTVVDTITAVFPGAKKVAL